MSEEEKSEKKRGPKGGMKHQPGRGHNRKSNPSKKKRFSKKCAKIQQKLEDARREAWKRWDDLDDDVKKLLGPNARPKLPRPKSE